MLSLGATLGLPSLKCSVYSFFCIFVLLITFSGLFRRNMWHAFLKRLAFDFFKIDKTLSKNLNKEKHGYSENEGFESLEKVIRLLL